MKKLSLLLILLCGCTDADWDRTFNYGEENTVQLYSGGELIKEWTTTGKIKSEENSDGYYFRSKETGKLVTVSGDVVITEK